MSDLVCEGSHDSAAESGSGRLPASRGPRHNGDLVDIVDLLFATSARIGEILALRWEDVDLAADHPTLTTSSAATLN
jgi:integrase